MMSIEPDKPVSMLRYVAIYFLVKLAAAGILIVYTHNFDDDPPISSTVIVIVALALAIGWFAKAVNRPMIGSERLWFAIGNTSVDLVLTLAWGLAMFWQTEASFSWEGLSQVLGGGGDPVAAKVGLLIGITVGLLPVPILSVFFGWLLTKNLPKEHVANN